MCWRCRCIVVVLGVACWTTSAAASPIQRFTDSQGVLHISNVPASARTKTVLSPALTKTPEPAQSLASTPAAAKPTAPTRSAGNEAATPAPEAALPAEPKPSPASPPASAGNAPQLPVTRVASMDREEAPPRPSVSSNGNADSGGIQRHRDAQGVWHITNTPTSHPESTPASQLRMAAGPTGGRAPARQEELPAMAAAGTAPAVQKVAWTGENGGKAAPVLAGSRPEHRIATGLIRSYRDSKGVLHITNVDPEPAAPPGSRQLLARVKHAEVKPPAKEPPPAPPVLEPPILQPVSWSGNVETAPTRVPMHASPQEATRVYNGIICRRDARGVISIANAPTPVATEPQAVEPLQLAARAQEAVSAPVPGISSPPLAGPPVEEGKTPHLNSPAPTILAYLDRQGRLTIRNREALAAGTGKAQIIPAELQAIIREAAQAMALPEHLIQALIKVESNFSPVAVSPKGAMGLMQLMPGTAADLGVNDPFCPRQNILGGCRYLRMLLNYFNDSLPLALAAYNAGHQRVVNAGHRIPAIKETQEFVTHVLERYYSSVARQQLQPVI